MLAEPRRHIRKRTRRSQQLRKSFLLRNLQRPRYPHLVNIPIHISPPPLLPLDQYSLVQRINPILIHLRCRGIRCLWLVIIFLLLLLLLLLILLVFVFTVFILFLFLLLLSLFLAFLLLLKLLLDSLPLLRLRLFLASLLGLLRRDLGGREPVVGEVGFAGVEEILPGGEYQLDPSFTFTSASTMRFQLRRKRRTF